MPANVALDLSPDGIRVLHRAEGRWIPIGTASPDDPQFEVALGTLRGRVEAMEPDGLRTELVIPRAQVLCTRVHAPGPRRSAQIIKAIEAMVSLPSDELAWDFRAGPDGFADVAVTERQTLREAEAFAAAHGFPPACFTSWPEADAFPGVPLFATVDESTVTRAGEPAAAQGDPAGMPDAAPVPDAALLVEPTPMPEWGSAAESPSHEVRQSSTEEHTARVEPGTGLAPPTDPLHVATKVASRPNAPMPPDGPPAVKAAFHNQPQGGTVATGPNAAVEPSASVGSPRTKVREGGDRSNAEPAGATVDATRDAEAEQRFRSQRLARLNGGGPDDGETAPRRPAGSAPSRMGALLPRIGLGAPAGTGAPGGVAGPKSFGVEGLPSERALSRAETGIGPEEMASTKPSPPPRACAAGEPAQPVNGEAAGERDEDFPATTEERATALKAATRPQPGNRDAGQGSEPLRTDPLREGGAEPVQPAPAIAARLGSASRGVPGEGRRLAGAGDLGEAEALTVFGARKAAEPRRRRRLLAVVAVAALVALLLGAFALREMNEKVASPSGVVLEAAPAGPPEGPPLTRLALTDADPPRAPALLPGAAPEPTLPAGGSATEVEGSATPLAGIEDPARHAEMNAAPKTADGVGSLRAAPLGGESVAPGPPQSGQAETSLRDAVSSVPPVAQSDPEAASAPPDTPATLAAAPSEGAGSLEEGGALVGRRGLPQAPASGAGFGAIGRALAEGDQTRGVGAETAAGPERAVSSATAGERAVEAEVEAAVPVGARVPPAGSLSAAAQPEPVARAGNPSAPPSAAPTASGVDGRRASLQWARSGPVETTNFSSEDGWLAPPTRSAPLRWAGGADKAAEGRLSFPVAMAEGPLPPASLAGRGGRVLETADGAADRAVRLLRGGSPLKSELAEGGSPIAAGGRMASGIGRLPATGESGGGPEDAAAGGEDVRPARLAEAAGSGAAADDAADRDPVGDREPGTAAATAARDAAEADGWALLALAAPPDGQDKAGETRQSGRESETPPLASRAGTAPDISADQDPGPVAQAAGRVGRGLSPAAETAPEAELEPSGSALPPVLPTPEGVLTARGVLVRGAPPPLRPPAHPARPAGKPAPLAALVDSALEDALAGTTGPATMRQEGLDETPPPSTAGSPGALAATSQADGTTSGVVAEASAGLADAAVSALRPRPRPADFLSAAVAPAMQTLPEGAVVASPLPPSRPADFAALAAGALAQSSAAAAASGSALRATAPPVELADEPEPRAAPSMPTRASVARQATAPDALNLGRINLIGVFGSSANRRALIRLPNGRFVRVGVGDQIDGGRVAAIGQSELRYVKGGRALVLQMPRT